MHFILIKNIRIMKKFGLFFISAFMMVLEGLRDRYIGSLFRVDEPVPDDSEPENSLSAVTDMIVKVGNVVQLFPRYYSADFCHIPPSRFSQDLRCRISTRGLRFQFDKKILVVKMTSKVAYLENFYNYDYLF